MGIRKLKIQNFKRFTELELSFSDGMNLLVGVNDAGKSTVLEAIHLACTGLLNGRYLRNELSQHLFNRNSVSDYISSVRNGKPKDPPSILIEVYLAEDAFPILEGNDNSERTAAQGFYLRVELDDDYRAEYESLVRTPEKLRSLPIEYYAVTWRSFARQSITARAIPLKSALVDSSAVRHQTAADGYVSRIVRDFLEPAHAVEIAQTYREMKDAFRNSSSIVSISSKIAGAMPHGKAVTLSADLPTRSDWEDNLIACVDDIPFPYVGKGEQSIVKTKLALQHRAVQAASVVLLEEPENHLTHANLNVLLSDIQKAVPDTQMVVSTHSSFVANKLGLDSLALLTERGKVSMETLTLETREFFQKIAGYDTLRLVLAKGCILVEGPSDELVVQRAYRQLHDGRLPIQDGIDVVSVGTSFLRFLEIAERLKKPVAVVTDNDGNADAIRNKYKAYLGREAQTSIHICFDAEVDSGALVIAGRPFNYNTLEPKLVKKNGLALMNKVLGTDFVEVDELHIHMRANKTDGALKIFQSSEEVHFPEYIVAAVDRW